ncbi:MAG: CooT family nickel-binding protein [Tyzzerella sp.]|nr:CooT family nickel-binding protein [Lachnospiraceae bacterium]MBP3663612.1 CooT family nickel-binding protein [Tyzzerella sp.]MEE1015226.1 CooT family nickel-binding protein [Lachnospiraceae bacterium]
MCLATVYGKKDDTESIILKNATLIEVEGKKIVIRDIIGMETVVEGEIQMVDLANAVVKIKVTAD